MLAAALALVPAGTSALDQRNRTVMTDAGPVTGVLHGRQRHFLGIPFAAPPVGLSIGAQTGTGIGVQ
jgi:uncharacterized membrane protein